MTRRTGSIERAYFDALYAADIDPWRFASSDYEREKYAASLAALPKRRFADGLEVGCSIGIFTAQLALTCDHLLAIDVSETALVKARSNVAVSNVTFANRRVPEEWPDGSFDLIVMSEMLYYLDSDDLTKVVARATNALREDGSVLLVHYLGETDYPMTGDAAADLFIAESKLELVSQRREVAYRIDVLARSI